MCDTLAELYKLREEFYDVAVKYNKDSETVETITLTHKRNALKSGTRVQIDCHLIGVVAEFADKYDYNYTHLSTVFHITFILTPQK